MKIAVESFGILKNWLPPSFEEEVKANTSIATIWDIIKNRYEVEEGSVETIRFAIDDQFVSPDTPLNKEVTLFLMPPSSGG